MKEASTSKNNIEWIDSWPSKTVSGKIDPNPIMGTCPRCGVELRRVMHYVCPQSLCPTGLGQTQVSF